MSVNSFTIRVHQGLSFKRGEEVQGSVEVQLKEECSVVSLSVVLRGKTSVQWTEAGLLSHSVYKAKEVHFCQEVELLSQVKERHVLPAGDHSFPFSLRFPDQDLPSSFIKLFVGATVYELRARMRRPGLRKDHKDRYLLSYDSTTSMASLVPGLMSPQHQRKSEKLWFKAGTVIVDVRLDRMGFLKEEGIDVAVEIQNNSSKPITTYCSLYSKVSGFVPRKGRTERKVKTESLVTEDLEAVPPFTTQTLHQLLHFPYDAKPCILNCSLLRLEYRLQVIVSPYGRLNIIFKFPIVLLPPLPPEEVIHAPQLSPSSS